MDGKFDIYPELLEISRKGCERMTRKERTLRCLQAEGVVIADSEPEALGRLAAAFIDYQKAVPDLTDRVDLLYVFRQTEQLPERQSHDGDMWHFSAHDRELIAIGLSIEVLQQEEVYHTYAILGHELTHIEHRSHDSAFHSRLNQVYERLYFETDKMIHPRNDYFGLEFRFDGRGGTLHIPPEQPHTPEANRIFRTGGKRVNT